MAIALLSSVLVTGAGTAVNPVTEPSRVYQATVVGTGAISATVNVEGSLDGTNWVILGIIALSGTTSATDGFASQAQWQYVRGNVTAITGTAAALTLLMSVQL